MRFSIIVPLYNKGPYVEKALRSILAQTFSDYELIVVNDGSQDDSLAVAKRVLEGSKATVINQKNAGVSTARNNGVAASHGDYICFLDADDWWEPKFLDEMDGLLRSFPDGGIYGTSYYYVKSGRRQVRVNISTGYFNYFKEYARNLQMPLWTGAVCVPKVIFNEMGGFKPNLKLGEDFDLWVRIALKYKTVFLNKPLAYYNQDVDVNNRGTRRLQKPENHMLWNLDCFNDEEQSNPEFKQLLDNLRAYSLMPYYLSRQYRSKAKDELLKINWTNQPESIREEYSKPIWLLSWKSCIMKFGSSIKQWLIRLRYDS